MTDRKTPRWLTRIPGVVGVASVLLLSCFVGMEATTRAEEWVAYGVPPLSPYAAQSDLILRDERGARGHPGARFRKWGINRLGFRGPEARAAKAHDTFRIVAMGASETFGLYEDEGAEFPRQLEDSLNAGVSSAGCHLGRFEVLNTALPGLSLPTAEENLRRLIRGLQPDLVLLYPTPVQYLAAEIPKAASLSAALEGEATSAPPILYPRSLVRVREATKRLLPAPVELWYRRWMLDRQLAFHPPGWRFTGVPEVRLRAFDADLRSFIGTIRSIGARPLLATHANAFVPGTVPDPDLLAVWEQFYPRAPGSVLIAFDSAAAEVTLRVAADSAVSLADLRATLRGREPEAFADYAHFTDTGSAVVAGALAAEIRTFVESSPCTTVSALRSAR